jgi:hypothetical protein
LCGPGPSSVKEGPCGNFYLTTVSGHSLIRVRRLPILVLLDLPRLPPSDIIYTPQTLLANIFDILTQIAQVAVAGTKGDLDETRPANQSLVLNAFEMHLAIHFTLKVVSASTPMSHSYLSFPSVLEFRGISGRSCRPWMSWDSRSEIGTCGAECEQE